MVQGTALPPGLPRQSSSALNKRGARCGAARAQFQSGPTVPLACARRQIEPIYKGRVLRVAAGLRQGGAAIYLIREAKQGSKQAALDWGDWVAAS